jgi:exodeoxyribonuclease V alpha subunit
MQHASLLRRDLLYTALTRGKRLVVLVGSRAALAHAVARGRGGGRWSRLRTWLAEGRADLSASGGEGAAGG